MKKIYIFFALLSFSLFISSVRADLLPRIVPQVIQDMDEDDFNALKTLMANNNITDYVIFYYYNSDLNIITDRIVYMNPSTLSCWNSGYNITSINGTAYNISADYSSLSVKRTYTSWDVGGGISPTFTFVIYSTVDFTYPFLCSTMPSKYSDYPIIYENNNYVMPTADDLRFYTIYDIYENLHGDPYPLFTSFFDIVIEKLQLICEFFTSSYIYLSIFVVIMFYFIILLLRRLT